MPTDGRATAPRRGRGARVAPTVGRVDGQRQRASAGPRARADSSGSRLEAIGRLHPRDVDRQRAAGGRRHVHGKCLARRWEAVPARSGGGREGDRSPHGTEA